ncbi:tRNA A64-2'-O-ribosylphosphate transferase [Coemansia sp. RSA 552]|nr:tRNA A64-2'-O-ribosylphosphate transferase [Coemansia sp. RSA 552]
MSDGIYRVAGELRRDSLSVYNRLQSIADDARFVAEVAELFPAYPVLPNERCGLWYVDPAGSAQTVYFKSTDGHHGQWRFSLRRANTHLLRVLGSRGGCLLVDSTRRGKSMPDALSRTVPLWCAVWNTVAARAKGDRDWDCRVYVPPSIVSDSERAQIEQRVPQFADELEASAIDARALVACLDKPLRPIWITRDHRLGLPPDFAGADFIPVICVSTSMAGPVDRSGFVYVQGAADDHELWAGGLTPRLFWKHRRRLLETDRAACAALVEDIVASGKTASSSGTDFAFVRSTGVAVGSRTSGRPPECWSRFDAVVNCGAPEYEPNQDPSLGDRYLFLPIPEGKKGQVALGKSIPRALEFIRPFLAAKENPAVLIHCSQGVDRSVGIALAILTRYYNDTGSFVETQTDEISKLSIQNRLLWITTSRAKANPSRATLKQVNRHFLDYI